jgi:hypothetical protein
MARDGNMRAAGGGCEAVIQKNAKDWLNREKREEQRRTKTEMLGGGNEDTTATGGPGDCIQVFTWGKAGAEKTGTRKTIG